MSTPQTTLWEIEPHTKAKHEILRRYLGAWFGILGRRIPRIVYIDGFCGPGRYLAGEPGSPIIALEMVTSHAQNLPGTEFVFIFIDQDKSRIEHLDFEIAQKSLPDNITTISLHGDFDGKVTELFTHLKNKGTQLAPTFTFVDPFGFSGISFCLISEFLKNSHTEVFVNIMADSMNRFIDHPDETIPQHIIDTFGTDEVIEIVKQSPNRFQALRDLYQRQLQKHAQFVRYFEMRDKNNRIIYYLFFASNHPLGHAKMKEAFWKIDSQTGFVFSDATNPLQPVLMTLDPAQELSQVIFMEFQGQQVLTEIVVHGFVEDQTAYTDSHAKSALKFLEGSRKVVVSPYKINGKKRRKNSFPDGVILNFAVE
jgi:three-Cys-motif partner protein